MFVAKVFEFVRNEFNTSGSAQLLDTVARLVLYQGLELGKTIKSISLGLQQIQPTHSRMIIIKISI